MVPNRRTRLSVRIITVGLLLSTFGFGCAASNVVSRRGLVERQAIPKPSRIIVFDVGSDETGSPRLAGILSQRLVTEFQAMGMSAERARGAAPAQAGDMIIHGEFVRVDRGSPVLRGLIGFGAGASRMRTELNAYVMEEEGRRPVHLMQLEAKGSYWPFFFALTDGGSSGDARRTAVLGSQILRRFFRRQNWIR